MVLESRKLASRRVMRKKEKTIEALGSRLSKKYVASLRVTGIGNPSEVGVGGSGELELKLEQE